jgi:hypothetical protein
MSSVQYLGLWNNQLTDLSPLKDMYEAGSFRAEGASVDFAAMNDSLELGAFPLSTRGQANQDVIDYMISHGVSMHYTGS